MGSKMIYSFVIFSLLYEVAFGCTYMKSNCIYEVHCAGNEYVTYDRVGGYYSNDCSRVAHYNGYNLLPVRLFIKGPISFGERLTFCDVREILKTFISLDITDNNLEFTPTLNAMENLKALNFSHNNLRVAHLYNEVELSKLEEIDLSHNLISSIQVNDHGYVYKNLRKVDLSHNAVTNISGGIFDSYKFMEYLDLSYNNLAVIDQDTFEGLKSLKYLDIAHNSISDINSSLFRFINLEKIYLDNNIIEKLSTRDFEKLERLQILNLEFNRISRIEKDTLKNMASLTSIKLNNNLLNFINEDAFLSTNNLKAVDLSNNLLIYLPKYLFRNKSLTSFSISGNNLEGALSKGIFEGIDVTELDISSQKLTALEDYAFSGLEQLTMLLLNNNRICNISYHAFNTLKNLNHLDLSSNLIVNLNFDTTDLLSLQTYSLGKNVIKEIRYDHFRDLKKLCNLDLSYNNITKLESNLFPPAENLKNFHIFQNSLNGILLQNTFIGLSSVPVLDLSCTSLTTIQNGSFSGMVKMQELNISRSLINVLEYHAFANTSNLKLIDLSYNKLIDFFVNTSDIRNLTTIFLNDNELVHISDYNFKEMIFLSKVVLSHNSLLNFDYNAFINQTELGYLDVSFNTNLTLHAPVIKHLRNLNKLILSCKINFTNITNIPLKYLEISHLDTFNVLEIQLSTMIYLTDLVLMKDNIIKIEPSTFRNLSVLERIDLSYNNISYIRPGSFKDNTLLSKLNLSHNFLTTLNYGIFKGLSNLKILDVSFNNIRELNRERFYDLPNIDTLFIDHNRIIDLDNDIFDINLRLLSIGNNPLPCEKIVQMKKRKELTISAINIDEHNGENIDGITCNVYNNALKVDMIDLKDSNQTLLGIKEILLNLLTVNRDSQLSSDSKNSDLLKNILNKMEIHDTEQKNVTYQLSQMTNEVNTSNLFLERILKVLVELGSQNKLIARSAGNITEKKYNMSSMKNNLNLSDLFSEVSQLKQKLLFVQNVISNIDRKISVDRTLSETLVSEKNNTSDVLENGSTGKSFGFVEICVTLILIILVCLILYMFYQSKMFVSNSRSLSTRHITDAMDNSNL